MTVEQPIADGTFINLFISPTNYEIALIATNILQIANQGTEKLSIFPEVSSYR
jgi:hypothetical protein